MRINSLICFLINCLICYYIFAPNYGFPSTTSITLKVITIISSLLFLSVFIFYKKISKKKKLAFKAIIIPLSIIHYATFAYFLAICCVSFPLEGPFEEKVQPEIVSKQEYSAGEEFISLLEKFNAQIDTSIAEKFKNYNYNDENVLDTLSKTSNSRKTLSDFIINNQIALPRPQNIDLSDLINNKIDLYPIAFFVNLELTEVEKMLDEKKYEEANDKYKNIWQTFESLLSTKNVTLIDSLTMISLTSKISSFHYNHQDDFENCDFTSIEDTLNNIISGINKNFATAFTTECMCSKNQLSKSYNRLWPFYDYYYSMRLTDNLYYSQIKLLENINDDSIQFEDNLDISINTFFSKNPTSKALNTISGSMLSGVVENLQKHKTKIGIHIYAMLNKNAPQPPPMNYNTGKELSIDENESYYEITLDSSKETYKILK